MRPLRFSSSDVMLTRKSSNGRLVPKLVIGIHQIRRRNLGGALRHRFLDKQESVYFLLETNLVTLCIFFNILMKCSAYRMQRLACSCRMTNTRGSHWNPCHWKGVHCRGYAQRGKGFFHLWSHHSGNFWSDKFYFHPPRLLPSMVHCACVPPPFCPPWKSYFGAFLMKLNSERLTVRLGLTVIYFLQYFVRHGLTSSGITSR